MRTRERLTLIPGEGLWYDGDHDHPLSADEFAVQYEAGRRAFRFEDVPESFEDAPGITFGGGVKRRAY